MSHAFDEFRARLEAGYSRDELDEAMAVAMMLGGSIVIPHARHASQSLDFLVAEKPGPSDRTPP